MVFSKMAEASRIDGAEAQEAVKMGIKLNLPSDKNFAIEDSPTYRYVMDMFLPTLREIISQRGQLEQEWLAIQQMTQLKHNSGRRYFGRSDAYLPTYARASLTQQSMLSKGLFPSDEYVDVWDRDQGQTEAAQWVKAYIQYEMDCSARLRSYIKPFLAQYVDLGTGVMKYWFRKDVASKGKSRVKGDVPELGLAVNSFEGLTVSVPSLFDTYVYPASADGLRGMIFIAERQYISRQYAEEMKRKKRWENVDEAWGAASMYEDGFSGNPKDNQTLQDKAYIQQPTAASENEATGFKYAWELWASMPMPKEAYVDGETVGEPLGVRIVLLGNRPVLIQRNPYFHQMAPYLFGRQQVQPGVFYGQGAGKLGMGLQYLVNDLFNQGNDVGIFTMNPLAVVNPSQLAGPLPAFRPGATVQVRDIKQAFGFERPPVELIAAGQQLTGTLVGMLQDVTGAPPILQGLGGGGKAGKTATGMQILQGNASGPLQDQVEDLENTVMVPLMEAAWSLGIQYRGQPLVMKLAGATGVPGEPMLPAQMDIDPEFKMLASSQSANKQVRAQQAMQFIQMVANPAILGLLQQQGRTFNPAPMLQRVYNDAMGFRGFEKVIPAMQPPMMPGMDPNAPQDPNARPAPGQDPRSAVEQAEGGQMMDTQPGEAEAFMDVRGQADDMAAQFGQLGPGAGFGGEE